MLPRTNTSVLRVHATPCARRWLDAIDANRHALFGRHARRCIHQRRVAETQPRVTKLWNSRHRAARLTNELLYVVVIPLGFPRPVL